MRLSRFDGLRCVVADTDSQDGRSAHRVTRLRGFHLRPDDDLRIDQTDLLDDGVVGIPFTLLAGIIISVGLILIARFASARVATFFVSFLAVQCVGYDFTI